MSLFAVKRHDDKFLCFDDFSDPQWDECPDIFSKGEAESLAEDYRGHIVELVEKPAPIVVSEAEAEMLERAQGKAFPAHIFDSGAAGSLPGSQDRLMRAYVIGWTVEKPKRYLVFKQLPGKIASNADDAIQATRSILSDKAVGWEFRDRDYLRDDDKYRFTDAEIEHYGLQGCEKTEVKQDGE